MPLSPPPQRPGWQRLGFTGALATVLGFQIYHLYGLHLSMDLPLWDESAYLGWGDQFLQDGMVGSITNSPAYHILYGAIIRTAGLLASIPVMHYLLKTTLTLLVFLLVQRWSRSSALGVFVGCAFAYSYYHLHCDVLVYYGALVPYLMAILIARRAPGLSLGLSFLAGLGRLEYMAVPAVHFIYLSIVRPWRDRPRTTAIAPTWLSAVPATAVWGFNLFALTCITVWQFHNRVWFAWSQNYAFFRYLTGRDSGGNPWLDHQWIAERDFPGAHSLREALAANPAAVLEHTWFNLRMLPGYLADFVNATPNAGSWRMIPAFAMAALLVAGLVSLARISKVRERLASARRNSEVEVLLCIGGVIAALPSGIISSKTNYIMSLLPLALLAISAAHRAASRASVLYARWNLLGLSLLTAALVFGSLRAPSVYSSRSGPGPVHQNVLTMREVLKPYYGLRILGVSTASYVNYLGREKGHIFVEPLAISPINRQADDLSLAGLIRTNHPEVLLINSHWRSSASYAQAVDGFHFDEWDAHPLQDGTLYTRKGLSIAPAYQGLWHEEENAENRTWRWSGGDASIVLPNSIDSRPVVCHFRARAIGDRNLEINLNGRQICRVALKADAWTEVKLPIARLPLGENRLSLVSDQPTQTAGNGDSRVLDVCIEQFGLDYPPVHLPERTRRRPWW